MYQNENLHSSTIILITTALRTAEWAVRGVKKVVPAGGTQGIPGSRL